MTTDQQRARRAAWVWLVVAWMLLAACCSAGIYLHNEEAAGWGAFFGISFGVSLVIALNLFMDSVS